MSRPIVRKINQFRVSLISESDLISQQKILFREIGIDWISAHEVVTGLVGKHIDFKSHRSQHYELFVGIAQLSSPKKILEIGTADGSFTAFLARAFPDALIETIDLPVKDKRFWNATDNQSGNERALLYDATTEPPELRTRSENLGSSSNIVFRERNSVELCRVEGNKYDLIWVDGDHTFPVVACDITNAVRLLGSGGVIMCDDIYLAPGRKGRWGSQETLKVLDVFREAKIISTHFVLKSVRSEKNYSPRLKKHLAVVKLVS